MRLSPHLSFKGSCEEAFRLYESALSGTIVTMLTYGASPMSNSVPLAWHEKIVHATLMLRDGVISGADAPPGEFKTPQGFQILYQPDNEDESRRVFSDLARGGEIVVPIQETFWSPCYGALVDRFSVPWEISCESEGETHPD